MCLGGACELCAVLLFCRWCRTLLPPLEESAACELWIHDWCRAFGLVLRDHVSFVSRLCRVVAHVYGDLDFFELSVAFVFLLMPSDFVLCLCPAFDHLDELFGLCLSNHVFVLICCQHTHQGGGNSENQIDMNLDFIVMSVF